jgi:hypothetical protein
VGGFKWFHEILRAIKNKTIHWKWMDGQLGAKIGFMKCFEQSKNKTIRWKWICQFVVVPFTRTETKCNHRSINIHQMQKQTEKQKNILKSKANKQKQIPKGTIEA